MNSHDWQPTADLVVIRERARLLQRIRAFFAERNVLEVETPQLSPAAMTDPQLESFSCRFRQADYYLHTSPEFYMKRLLAAGSGDIYQLARVFRQDELGPDHRPEFTLLEWYRIGMDHHQLMQELEQLIRFLWADRPVSFESISYRQAFLQQLQLDPLTADAGDLQQCARRHHVEIPQGMDTTDKDMWLDWLMVDKIAPAFNPGGFTFLYDYPASQAALARLSVEDPRLAHRFELFYGELELANGFYELSDAMEQQQRFEKENALRRQRGQKTMPMDKHLLAALQSGLPDCSGVALGIDRLLMLITGAKDIGAVISFADEMF